MLYVRCTGEAVQCRGHLLLGEEMEVQSVTVDFEKPRKSFVVEKWQQRSGDTINSYVECSRRRKSG